MLRLQSALDECQLNETQLKHKLEVQTETLNNKVEELRALSEHTQSSMSSEMMEVQMKIMELENIKVSGKLLTSWWKCTEPDDCSFFFGLPGGLGGDTAGI